MLSVEENKYWIWLSNLRLKSKTIINLIKWLQVVNLPHKKRRKTKMTKLKRNTQKARRFIKEYWTSSRYNLDECYNNYSNAKYNAYKYCINKKDKMNGYDGRIISYNTCFFSYAFMTNDNKLIVICPTNEYEIQL